MEQISSTQNVKFKRWKKCLTTKGRKEHQCFLVEGIHMVQEALLHQQKIEGILLEEGRSLPQELEPLLQEQELTLLASSLFQQLVQTVHSQGIIAVIKAPELPRMEELISDADHGQLHILVDGVQDPGNLGTIIRTADAVGATSILLGKGCVDLYNDKVLRATMGSIFHLPILQIDLLQVIPHLKQADIQVIAAMLGATELHTDFGWKKQTAIVVGNEGNGVCPEVEALVDECLSIPMYGAAESLNVAVATALLMYEWRRHYSI